jgi:hypothetical protein
VEIARKPPEIQELAGGARRMPGAARPGYACRMRNAVENAYARLRSELLARREALAREIGRHPRPITACDVHFNRLLEERAALSQELDGVDALIAGSSALTTAEKRRLLAAVENVVCP